MISELKKQKEPLFQRLATELSRAHRQTRAVNLSRIEKNLRNGETAVVPGKVLASGVLSKKVTVAAFSFSEQAREKIKSAGGVTLTILDLIKKKVKKARIIG